MLTFYLFRCPTVLSIVIRVLQSSLAASRSHLSRLVNQKLFMTGQLLQANNREEYKNVLTAAQDSAAVQLLLEACLETENDQVNLLFFRVYYTQVVGNQ